MAQNLDELLAEVEEANTVADGAITLLDQLKALLDEAVRVGNPAEIIAKVKAISASIGTQKQEITDALIRNTPAAPPPTP